jgi:OmpA-OmpF porin, OOP family
MRSIIISILLVLGLSVQGQSTKPPENGDNIVPNPSFERFGNIPIGWTYKGSDFSRVVKYWFSATTASPDVYGPGVRVPSDWSEKGFGKQTPHTGKSMIGITVYGCVNGKPHCREYVEIQMAEPLVEGQNYEVSYWACPLEKSMYSNNLGAYFSVKPIDRKTDEILVRNAQIQSNSLVKPQKKGQWTKVISTFVATYEAEHIVIGNFNDDNNTIVESSGADGYNYAYYYIDDVTVRKIPPFKKPPIKKDDLSLIPLEKGKKILLKNIYFEFDKAELMPRSYVELNKLLTIMKGNPTLCIEIAGHTDSDGSDDYNNNLSQKRAEAVMTFLKAQGVSAKRLQAKGKGEAHPIASNDTDEGKAENRRVEFEVLKK